MNLNFQKELTPVLYGKRVIKYLTFSLNPNSCGAFIHWHERIEILIVKKGAMKVSIGDNISTLSSGGIAVVSPCKPHSIIVINQEVEYDVIMFELKDLINSSGITKDIINKLLDLTVEFKPFIYDQAISNIINKITQYYSDDTNSGRMMICGYLYLLIGSLYDKYSFSNSINLKENNNFKNIINYIQDNCIANITVNNISSHFGYTEEHFCRLFKRFTGLTTTKYITILRLEHSLELLKNTDLSIEEISLAIGYKDSNYYTRCFKYNYGYPPTKYRKYQIQ